MPATETPIGLLAELTHRCPLQCPYCSNPLELERAAGELATEEWARVFREAAALGVLQLHLSGGEPMARRDIAELVGHAASAGLYTNLITSGVTLDRGNIEALAAAGLDHVQLSVQDAEAGSADRIAGSRGAHAKKRAAARLVRDAGLPLTLNAVVHRQNLGRLPALIDLAVELGAARLEVAHVQYHGWAFRNRAALMPTEAQVDEASATVTEARARARLRGALVIDYVEPDYFAVRPKPCLNGWGRQAIVVSPRGAALPCHAASSLPGLRFDNVRARPLADIWLYSDAFEKFRGTGWMGEPCRSCAFREVDWGGCRCQALALGGDAAATDPACRLSPQHAALRRAADEEGAAGKTAFAYRRFTPLPKASGASR